MIRRWIDGAVRTRRFIRRRIRQLLCAHVEHYDGLLVSPEVYVVRVRCRRCGKASKATTSVRRPPQSATPGL